MAAGRGIDQMLAWLIAIALALGIFAGFHYLTKDLKSIAEYDDESGRYLEPEDLKTPELPGKKESTVERDKGDLDGEKPAEHPSSETQEAKHGGEASHGDADSKKTEEAGGHK